MMEKTELCSDDCALDDNELEVVAGGVDGGAALRAAAAAYLVVSVGGHPYTWFAAAYKLA
jgi:hypothetical protein